VECIAASGWPAFVKTAYLAIDDLGDGYLLRRGESCPGKNTL
jgi:hypothetical protein